MSRPGVAGPASHGAAGNLCAHLLEAIAFLVVGAAAAAFLPFPEWARWTMIGGFAFAAGTIGTAALLHHKIGRLLPRRVDRFLADASASPRVLAHAFGILVATWVVRWLGIVLLLHALGIEAGLGAALVYMVVTGLANTAPILPGNAGVYQGAALGALAMVGEAGAKAVAVGLVAPLFASAVTAAAALAGVCLYGRRFAEVFASSCLACSFLTPSNARYYSLLTCARKLSKAISTRSCSPLSQRAAAWLCDHRAAPAPERWRARSARRHRLSGAPPAGATRSVLSSWVTFRGRRRRVYLAHPTRPGRASRTSRRVDVVLTCSWGRARASWLGELDRELRARGVPRSDRRRIAFELEDHRLSSPNEIASLGDPQLLAQELRRRAGNSGEQARGAGRVCRLGGCRDRLRRVPVRRHARRLAGHHVGRGHAAGAARGARHACRAPGGVRGGPVGVARSDSNSAIARRSRRRRDARHSSDGDRGDCWSCIARRARPYAIEYPAGLATWWTVTTIGTAAALTVPLVLAALLARRAARIRSTVEGDAGDVFDDLPVHLPRRPWALCAAVALFAAASTGVAGGFDEGPRNAVFEALAVVAGFVVLRRPLGLRPRSR